MLRLVMDAGYDDYLKENLRQLPRRLDELRATRRVRVSIRQSVEEFPHAARLAHKRRGRGRRSADDDAERIRLSTIHQAKGLEFDVVFVIMLCDGLFPSGRSLESEKARRRNGGCFTSPSRGRRTSLYLSYPLCAPASASPAAIPCNGRRGFCRKSRGPVERVESALALCLNV